MKSTRQIIEAIKCRIRQVEAAPLDAFLTQSDAALMVREYHALLRFIKEERIKKGQNK